MTIKLSLEDKNITINELYNYYIIQNKSINKISNIVKVDKTVIKRWLKENNIKIDSDRNCQKYRFNQYYFDIIDSKEKAYWIGFIWSDGYVCKRKRGNSTMYEFKLALSEVDESHLEKLKLSLEANYEIKKYDIKGFKTKNQEARLYISNKYFAKILYDNYGLISHRFDTSKLINNIPKEYYKDFIRGIIDAEGSITCKLLEFTKSSREEFSLGITTYEEILVFINNVLIENGLTETVYKLTKRHLEKDEYCKVLNITGNNIVFNILDWIYGDSSIFLERKYNKFIHVKEYRNNYIKEKGGINNGKGQII